MPTVRLEFELDSDIYPELHAALAALRSTRARAERMRQLAAAGLVWEKVRLQGAAVTAEAMPAPVPVPAPPVTVTVSPPARERRNRRPSRADVEQVMRELPVLMDVVADVRPLPEPHDDDTPHEEPAPWAAMNAYPDDIPADSGADDDSTSFPDATLHVTALSHKPATRSRLMRMKERGLFKNG
jgi:hypothetical protein